MKLSIFKPADKIKIPMSDGTYIETTRYIGTKEYYIDGIIDVLPLILAAVGLIFLSLVVYLLW